MVWRSWHCSRRPRLGIGDGVEEMRPIVEDDVGGDGAQVLEEAVSGAARGEGGAPGEDAELGDGVEGEGEQVEGDEEAGEGLLAMAEIVLEVVAVRLEDVEGLVLDLPAGATAGGEVGNRAGGDG